MRRPTIRWSHHLLLVGVSGLQHLVGAVIDLFLHTNPFTQSSCFEHLSALPPLPQHRNLWRGAFWRHTWSPQHDSSPFLLHDCPCPKHVRHLFGPALMLRHTRLLQHCAWFLHFSFCVVQAEWATELKVASSNAKTANEVHNEYERVMVVRMSSLGLWNERVLCCRCDGSAGAGCGAGSGSDASSVANFRLSTERRVKLFYFRRSKSKSKSGSSSGRESGSRSGSEIYGIAWQDNNRGGVLTELKSLLYYSVCRDIIYTQPLLFQFTSPLTEERNWAEKSDRRCSITFRNLSAACSGAQK